MQRIRAAAVLCLALLLCAGCSGGGNEGGDQQANGRVERLTDEAADQAAGAIRRPMDQAQAARALGNAHVEDMARQVEENTR